MYSQQQMLDLTVQILLIAGALNWGSSAFQNYDFVNALAGATNGSYIKMVVGLAGIYAAYSLFMKFYSQPAPASA
jgi:uncharacterized membrane protein YuzA (DUF378 family)